MLKICWGGGRKPTLTIKHLSNSAVSEVTIYDDGSGIFPSFTLLRGDSCQVPIMYNNRYNDAIISYIPESLPFPYVHSQNDNNCTVGNYGHNSSYVQVHDRAKDAYIEIYLK